MKDLKLIKSQIDVISKKSENIANAIEQAEEYSYQYNPKITGVPQQREAETAEETTALCIKLFHAIAGDRYL
jgi:prefoldin subunit 5